MTKQELEDAVIELIDQNCIEMDLEDYKDFLDNTIGNLQSRLDAAEND